MGRVMSFICMQNVCYSKEWSKTDQRTARNGRRSCSSSLTASGRLPSSLGAALSRNRRLLMEGGGESALRYQRRAGDPIYDG